MRRLTMLLSLALVLVICLGVGAGFLVGRKRAEAASVPASPITAGPTTGADPATSGSAGPATENRTVTIGVDAAGHPQAEQIRTLLQGYFDGINKKSYKTWAKTVDAQQAADRPAAQWKADYTTTIDFDIAIDSINSDTSRVRVSFKSNQSVQFAPPDLPVECIQWRVLYNLVQEDGKILVGQPVSGETTKNVC